MGAGIGIRLSTYIRQDTTTGGHAGGVHGNQSPVDPVSLVQTTLQGAIQSGGQEDVTNSAIVLLSIAEERVARLAALEGAGIGRCRTFGAILRRNEGLNHLQRLISNTRCGREDMDTWGHDLFGVG
jgi:hypothetical protein